MNKKTNVKLYNICFPIWLLWFYPLTWFLVLPINYIVDCIVVSLTLYCLKLNDERIFIKIINKVVIFGFIADIIGAGLMYSSKLFGASFSNTVLYSNAFKDIWAILWVTVSVLVTAIVIYFFNYTICFKKLTIDIKLKKKLALSLAIFTAPYMFYLPTDWIVNFGW